MSRSVAARVSRDRIDRIPARNPGRPVTGWLGDEALTAQIKLGDDMPEAAAYEVAWLAAERHACTSRHHGDPPCGDVRHAGDVAAGARVLEVLGLLKPGA